MRLIRCLALAAAVLSSSSFAAVSIGQPAPAFSLPGSDGKVHALADYAGKWVVLEWTNSECPFVRKHYSSGNMQSLQKEAAAQGVAWLSVISSAPGMQGNVSATRAAELSRERGATPTAVLLDESGEVGRLYGAKTTPDIFIIGKDGKLIYSGGVDSIASADPEDIALATPYVKVALAEALAGKPLSHPLTAPYGCSVKYSRP